MPFPFFSTIVLCENRSLFPWVFDGRPEKIRIPGKNGEGTPRGADNKDISTTMLVEPNLDRVWGLIWDPVVHITSEDLC